jgi:hypothetical protein
MLMSLEDEPHRLDVCIWNTNNDPDNFFDCLVGEVVIIDGPYFCNIPPNNCVQVNLAGDGFLLFYDPDPQFADFFNFCSASENMIRVCNPETRPIKMHIMCDPDAPGHQQVTFQLAPSQCKTFRIGPAFQVHCHIFEC